MPAGSPIVSANGSDVLPASLDGGFVGFIVMAAIEGREGRRNQVRRLVWALIAACFPCLVLDDLQSLAQAGFRLSLAVDGGVLLEILQVLARQNIELLAPPLLLGGAAA